MHDDTILIMYVKTEEYIGSPRETKSDLLSVDPKFINTCCKFVNKTHTCMCWKIE